MKYLIPSAGCFIVAQYWIDGMAGVGVALLILVLFHWFGEMAEKEVGHE